MTRHAKTQRIAPLLKPGDPNGPKVDTPGRLAVYARSGLCPRCGELIPPDGPDAPVGMTGVQLAKARRTACLCENCGFPLRRWKRMPRNAPRCEVCGAKVLGADPRAEAVVCWECTHKRLAALEAGKVKPQRSKLKCRDCGDPLPLSRQRPGRCEKCRGKHRRATWRKSKRKAGQHSTVSASRTPINTGRNEREIGGVDSGANPSISGS